MVATPQSDTLGVPGAFRDGTREAFVGAAFPAPARAEVVVVGAGITGLSAALTLAEAGVDVLVLEARHVGAGASGRAFGQVVPVSKHSAQWIQRRFGVDRGAEIVDFLASGPDHVFSLIERHGIDCEAVREGMFLAVHHPGRKAGVLETAGYWTSRGVPVELVGGTDLAARLGTDRYDLAMLDPRIGTVNGFGLARGLARAAAGAGARVVEACPVETVAKQGRRWALRTPHGEVSAASLVFATNAYSDSPWPALGRSILPMRGYGLVSRPIDPALRGGILPGGQSLMDTRRLFSGIRLRDDGRLHVSADGPAFAIGAADRERAGRRVASLFPRLGPIEWDEVWAGWLAMNAPQFPALHRLDDRVYAALGYSGRGLALAALLGREVAREIVGERNRPVPIPFTAPAPLGSRIGAVVYSRALVALYRVLDRLELRGVE